MTESHYQGFPGVMNHLDNSDGIAKTELEHFGKGLYIISQLNPRSE